MARKSAWDVKFLLLAKHVGEWSKCFSRHIGAVLVRDKTVIAMGYNGPPRGVPHCDSVHRKEEIVRVLERKGCTKEITEKIMYHRGCPRKAIDNRSGTALDLCPAGHSERNAIVNAAREGVIVKGADLYCYCPVPCFECAKSIINAGISKVICLEGVYDDMAPWLFAFAGVKIIQIDQADLDKHTI